MRILSIFLALMMISQVAYSAEPKFGSSAQSSRALKMAAPKGKALIYIFYHQHTGAEVSPKLWLNRSGIGSLVPGSFTVWQIAPGSLTVRADGDTSSSISLKTKQGKKYYLQLSVRADASGTHSKLRFISPSRINKFSTSRWLSNPNSLGSEDRKIASSKETRKSETSASSTSDEDDSSTYSGNNYNADNESAVVFKTGMLGLSETSQTILGVARSFSDDASGVINLEYYKFLGDGFSLGAELSSYSAEFTSVGLSNTHNVDVLLLHANAKQYFRNYSDFRPFIGAGIGLVNTDVSGPDLSGSIFGASYQMLIGAEYRFSNISLLGEYKYLSAESSDSNDEKVNVSGSGLFVGLAVYF